jgi:hypothetical protein
VDAGKAIALLVGNDLHPLERGAVVDFEKGKALRVAPGAHPALDKY